MNNVYYFGNREREASETGTGNKPLNLRRQQKYVET
jgi:hypothetical protein